MKRKTSMKATRLRRRSKKQAARQRAFARELVEYLNTTDGRCHVRSPVCTGRAQGWHHPKKRSRGGSDERRNRMPSCDACNGWVEDHETEAHALGLSLNSWEPEGGAA